MTLLRCDLSGKSPLRRRSLCNLLLLNIQEQQREITSTSALIVNADLFTLHVNVCVYFKGCRKRQQLTWWRLL